MEAAVRPLFRKLMVCGLFVGVLIPAPCRAGLSAASQSPLQVVRNSNQSILDIYAERETINQAAEDEIFRIIDEVTDFEAIAEAVAERFCGKLTAEQCREFKDVFIELLQVSSVRKLGRYRADSFDYLGESRDEGQAVVDTVAHFEEEQLSLVYHLALDEGKWRIVNYVVDDVDTIRNYRKQFKRLFAKKNFEEVVQRLRDRIASYEQEAAQ
jgi:ABC-type transporter MlaC component